MKNHRWKITLEDESKLEKIIQFRAPVKTCILIGCSIFFIIMALGAILMAISPVKRLLPGYLHENERLATEEQHLRIDSLMDIYENESVYLLNLKNIISKSDSIERREIPQKKIESSIIDIDSLLAPTKDEREFSEMMSEREKYNASFIAPIEAGKLMFSPVNNESLISDATKNSIKAEVILAKDTYIGAIADGIILAVSNSFDNEEKTSVIIQHPNGFVSRYSKLGTCLVKPGESVIARQAIAIGNKYPSSIKNTIFIEMWHNGTRLIPSEYLEPKEMKKKTPVMDKDIGRGRI